MLLRRNRRQRELVPGRIPFLVDDGSSVVIAVEEIGAPHSEGDRPQALWVRVGPVFDEAGQRSEPGIWIEYQARYVNSSLEGPLLLDARTWRALNTAVERRLRKWR